MPRAKPRAKKSASHDAAPALPADERSALDADIDRLEAGAKVWVALTHDQRERIERTARLLPLDVPTIELAGGSVRCMLAGVHLDPRPGLVERQDAGARADDATADEIAAL